MYKDETAHEGEAVILPEETGTSPEGENVPKKVVSIKPWMMVGIGAVVGILLMVGVYFLFLKPKVTEKPTNENTQTDTVSEMTDDEVIAAYDHDIEASETADDKFVITVGKAVRLAGMGRANEALATMSTIDESGLDTAQRSRLYAAYVEIYISAGDDEQVQKYQTLYNELYEKIIEESGV